MNTFIHQYSILMGVFFKNYRGKIAIIQNSDVQTFELNEIQLSLNFIFL